MAFTCSDHGRWLALGIPHRSLGELNEFCDQRATTCRHPCQPHFARRDVGDRRPGDVGALVVGGRRFGKHTETTSRRDMFELLLDAARLGCRRGPLPSAHFFCHRTPFGYGISVLEQVLTGEVVQADGLLAGESMSRGASSAVSSARRAAPAPPTTSAPATTGGR